MTSNLYKIVSKNIVGSLVIEKLHNFDCDLTDKRILEELEYVLYICDDDGWETHLENVQQLRSLKILINKCKQLRA